MMLFLFGFVLFALVYWGTIYIGAKIIYGNPYPKAKPGYTYGVLDTSFLDYPE